MPLQGDVKGEMGTISVVGERKNRSQTLQGHVRNPQCCCAQTKRKTDKNF